MRWYHGMAAILVVCVAFWLGYRSDPNNMTNQSTQPLVVIVPHHDLVKKPRSAVLQALSVNSQPDTIVVISTNHFNIGTSDIITTDRAWVVNHGEQTIAPATDIIAALTQTTSASIEDSIFDGEHGIKNLLGEIKEFYPAAQLVPIIIKDTVQPEALEELLQFFSEQCRDCGLMASVDMSHYQPAKVAEIHDKKTIRALTNLDELEILNVEVDSNPALWLTVQWAKARGLEKFVLADHTNSGLLVGDMDAETTTHIMGYYMAGERQFVKDSLTFTFAGDGMFGREIGYQFQNDFSALFSNLGNRTFWGTDISWMNLEGPISENDIEQSREPQNLSFNFSNQALDALKYLKLTTVGLGNNHTHNQGRLALETTQQLLTAENIDWNGHPTEVSQEAIQRYTQGELTVALIAANVMNSSEGVEQLVQQEHQAGNVVIVLPHWGQEYFNFHSPVQEEQATTWIAAGADLIIGSHPHVVQAAQMIDGKLVIYSLGNFVFDQTFSTETQQGLIVTGELTADEIKIVLVPTISRNYKPEIAQGKIKQAIIDHVCSDESVECVDGVVTYSWSPGSISAGE